MKVHGGFIPRDPAVRLREKEQARDLAQRLPAALETKDPKELGNLLKDVKALGPAGERQFVAAALGALGKKPARDGATLGKLVMSALPPEQRMALAKELFPLEGLKGRLILATGSLEAKLGKFLAGIGGDRAGFLPNLKDEVVRASRPNPFESALSPSPAPAPVEVSAEDQAEVDRIRAEMAKKQI